MSGGPQVFLGTTTFLLRTPPDFQPLRGMWGRAAWCARGRRPDREPSAPRGLRGRAAWCARGRRPARSPSALRASLAVRATSFARRVGSKPGQAPPPPTGTAARPRRPCYDRLLNNVARNSLTRVSNVEVASLELQRFERVSKTDPWELCATFVLADVVASSHR